MTVVCVHSGAALGLKRERGRARHQRSLPLPTAALHFPSEERKAKGLLLIVVTKVNFFQP